MLPVRRNNQVWVPDIFNDFFDNSWMEHPKATCPAINVEDGDLVIKMEKKQEEQHKGHFVRREFSYTKFQQTMLLPDDTNREAINAKVENGVLTVTMPKVKKVEAEKARKQITVE